MYINSPGGQPYSILGVVDTMQAIKPPIKTVALGACYSYASLLVVSGAMCGRRPRAGDRHAFGIGRRRCEPRFEREGQRARTADCSRAVCVPSQAVTHHLASQLASQPVSQHHPGALYRGD